MSALLALARQQRQLRLERELRSLRKEVHGK
jgi:hypothetical protein